MSGYVKKIQKSMNFYPDGKCEEDPFISNVYSYTLEGNDGNVGMFNYCGD